METALQNLREFTIGLYSTDQICTEVFKLSPPNCHHGVFKKHLNTAEAHWKNCIIYELMLSLWVHYLCRFDTTVLLWLLI